MNSCKGSGDTGTLGVRASLPVSTTTPRPSRASSSHEPLRPAAVVPDPPSRHQSRPRTRPEAETARPTLKPSPAPSLWKQQQGRAVPTLQAGPPALTLTNEVSDTAGGMGGAWQRGSREVSCSDQDSLGKPAPAECPEAVPPLTTRLVTSRCLRILLWALSALGSDRPSPPVKGELEGAICAHSKRAHRQLVALEPYTVCYQ